MPYDFEYTLVHRTEWPAVDDLIEAGSLEVHRDQTGRIRITKQTGTSILTVFLGSGTINAIRREPTWHPTII